MRFTNVVLFCCLESTMEAYLKIGGRILKAAYLGPKATFTDMAVQSAFPHIETRPYMTIPDCMRAVENKEVHIAVVPLENALEGSVNLTIDYLFHEVNLPIVAEIIVPIQQHLMVHRDHALNWQQVEKILSHSHAIAQCHKYLHREFPHATLEQTTSTAAAAKFVSEHPEMKIAAIANKAAAQKYQLDIVEKNIHDYSFNHTRFIVLSNLSTDVQIALDAQTEKTTMMLTLPKNRSGALHQVLSAFAWRNIDLSKIESRPLKTGLGDYFFIIDINQKMDEVLLPNAITEIETLGCTVKVLGSYCSYALPPSNGFKKG